MAKIAGILAFGAVLFALSAGGSWFVMTRMQGSHSHTEEKASGHAAAADAHGHAKPAVEAPAQKESAPVAAAAPERPADDRLPVAVRPREMSVEELLRYGMGIREREQLVKQQEEQLQKRRVQQQLALTDIQGERKEIDGLRVQISGRLKEAEQLINQLNALRTKIKDDQTAAAEKMQQIKHERVEIDQEHMDNTKRLSQWIQSMEPEKAAEVLKSMAHDGEEQTEIAVQILRNLEEREAAKILSAIEDPKLVQLLIEKFRNLKRPPEKTATRR
jgi:hypothetical protein